MIPLLIPYKYTRHGLEKFAFYINSEVKPALNKEDRIKAWRKLFSQSQQVYQMAVNVNQDDLVVHWMVVVAWKKRILQ